MCLTCWVSTCWTPKWKTTLLLFCHDCPTCRDHNTPSCWEETKTAFEIFLLAWITQTNLISKYLPSTTLYYRVLLQYYSVLQSSTPILFRTTKYYSSNTLTTKSYSSTTLYYKVLVQYYSVLQSTSPVLLCTTKHYSGTTLYYKVLLQYYKVLLHYYFVLHSATPVLLCTTKYYSSTTLYYKVLLQYYSVLHSTTPVLLQYYSALQNTTPVLESTAPVLVCTTKYLHTWNVIDNSMRGATRVIVQTHQILRLPRKMNLMIDPCHTWNAIYNARSNKWHCPNSPNTAPATQNDSHDQSATHLKRYLQCAEQQVASSNITKYCACHEKWLSWSILFTHETLFTMRGATSVIVQTHQYCACHEKWLSWSILFTHETLYLQCAEQQVSLSKLTKYCACHEKWISWLILVTHETLFTMRGATSALSKLTKYCACHAKWLSKILQKFLENSWNVISNAGPIREWSGQDPRMIRAGSENGTVTPQPASQARLLFTPTTSILYWKIQHFALRLSFQISPNTAPATKSDTSTSPNTAPATKNESHDWSLSHMKRYLQCAEQQVSLSKLTKYCACHEKWLSWSILFTHETLFTMRGATRVIVQTHQILRHTCHCPNSPNTAPATKNESHDWSLSHMKRYLQCAEQQASLSKLTKYCASHAKWLSKILQKFLENRSITMRDRSETIPRMIRAGSENDPRMKPSLRNPPRKRGYFSRSPRAFSIEKYNISRSGYHSKFHQILRLPRKVTLFNFTKYCACHEKWLSWSILFTHETLFTMHGATRVIVQTHQILRLPRKMNLMIDPCHTWNAIYNARSNKRHCPNSPNTAPATQNDSPKFCKNFSKTDETSITMRDRSETIPRMIRAGSENDPRMKPSLRNPPRKRGYFSRSPRAFSIEKYNISRSGYHSKFHQILRLPRKVTLQLHQILRLPRKVTLVINPLHTWNAIYNARSNTCHCPNSPNTAPATKNESHDWSLSHMKRYLQCAEQQASLSKLTKYCACHEKWLSKILQKFLENRWNVKSITMRDRSETIPRMIRAGSENDPRMKPSLRNPPRKRGYFSRSPRAFCIEKYNISHSGYHSKFHQILRLPRKVTLQLHQILRLPRKMTLMINPRHTWNAIYNARNNRWHPPTSPNTAPATPNDSPKFQKHFSKTDETSITMRDRSETIPSWIRAGCMKPSSATRLATEVTFHDHHDLFVLKITTFRAPAIILNFTECCACHEKWQFNITKYCACHEKCHLNVTK